MDKSTDKELLALIDQAVAGDKQSLETVILSVQDLVFNQIGRASCRDRVSASV